MESIDLLVVLQRAAEFCIERAWWSVTRMRTVV